MDKQFYFSISVHSIDYEKAQEIITAVQEIVPGISFNVFYENAVSDEELEISNSEGDVTLNG